METFLLEWDNFQDNLATSLNTLRCDGELFDVTLACDDGQVEAHKVILSAASTFFKQIIKRNPHPHPLFYLKGSKIDILKSMLDFMYFGKSNVGQDLVESFLALGEELEVKGLVKNKDETQRESFQDNSLSTQDTECLEEETTKFLNSTIDNLEDKPNESSDMRDLHKDETFESNEDNLIEKGTSVKEDKELKTTYETRKTVTNSQNEFSDENNKSLYSAVDIEVNSLMEKRVDSNDGPIWQCVKCDKFSKNKGNLKKHVEIHITGLCFPCKFCDKTFKTRNVLNAHMHTNKPCNDAKIFEKSYKYI